MVPAPDYLSILFYLSYLPTHLTPEALFVGGHYTVVFDMMDGWRVVKWRAYPCGQQKKTSVVFV